MRVENGAIRGAIKPDVPKKKGVLKIYVSKSAQCNKNPACRKMAKTPFVSK